MLKGKSGIIYTLMKLTFYLAGYLEFAYYHQHHNKTTLYILMSLLFANSFIRQYILYGKDNLHRYGKISIILEFIFAALIAKLNPVAPVILFLTYTIFESMVAHSLLFGGSLTAISLVTLITIDILSRTRIYDLYQFLKTIFISYGLGHLLVAVISYLAALQFREREKIARTNLELEQAYKQLLDNATKLQELSIEKERNRMAREIHDTLAHTLTAAVVQMEACKKLLDVDVPRARVEVGKAQELLRTGLGDVKRTIKALRPEVLENCSISCALHSLIKDIEESTRVKVKFNENLQKETEISSSLEVTLFRVIQESITNAIRHGAAKEIEISMIEDDNRLNINIKDDGRGCAHIKEGYGLGGIIERIKALNGTVQFSSSAGKGFNTQITIPYKGGITSGN